MAKVIPFQAPVQPENDFFLQVSLDLLSLAVSDKAKILYLHLLKYCKRGKYQCWPSQPTLAENTSWCERTVRTCLQELATSGAITIHPPRPPVRSHNIYELHLVADRLTTRQHVATPPAKNDTPPGKILLTPRQHVAAESHDELHDHVCEAPPGLVESDSSQNTSNQGYVALLLEICGSVESATRIAALVPAGRNEEYVRNCIEYAKTRDNPPGWLTTVFRSGGTPPALHRPPEATRTATRGHQDGHQRLKGWNAYFSKQIEEKE